MAKRRRRKKNPTTAQWVVLGVGGAVGLGLLGYGVSLALKNRKVEKQLGGGSPEGSGAPGQEWQYTLRRGFRRPRKGKGRKWMATVYEPGGRNPQILPGYETREAADDAAKVFITSRGGVPVFREKKDDVVQVFDGFVAIPMS